MSGSIRYQFIAVEQDGPVTVIRFDRPEVRNALHSPAQFECAAAFDAFAGDPDQWVAIVTGAGDQAFCAGNDLKYQAAGGRLDMPPSGFAGLTSRFDLAKPIIAAVNGFALGGGFEAALACDLIVAAQNAVFALPEPQVGLVALAGGLHRLPRAIGVKRAMDMILTSRRVTAAEGRELGFVSQVVATGEALAAARQVAAHICKSGPLAIRAAKRIVMDGLDRPLDEAMRVQWEVPALVASRASDDYHEGPRAFAEKRAPAWTGR